MACRARCEFPIRIQIRGGWIIAGEFAPDGAAAPTITQGARFTVGHSGAPGSGEYLVTLEDPVASVMLAEAWRCKPSAAVLDTHHVETHSLARNTTTGIVTFVISNKTEGVAVFAADDIVADPDSRVAFRVMVSDTLVP